MQLTLLGTGSPEPSLKRAGSSYMIRTGGDVILFDVGPGAFHRLLEAGVEPTQVTHVFFSHLHYDHCADLVRLFLAHWDMGSGLIGPMKIYGPPGTQRFVNRLFGPEGAFADDLTARINHPSSQAYVKARGGVLPRRWPETKVTEIKESDVIEGTDWRVRLANVPHVQPYLVCYGYRMEGEGGVFTYSGDCGPNKAMQALAAEADVLVHMCVKMDHAPKDPAGMPYMALAELARDARVRTLIASHLNPRTDADGVRERLIAEMGAVYKGRLIWAQDGLSLPVRSNA